MMEDKLFNVAEGSSTDEGKLGLQLQTVCEIMVYQFSSTDVTVYRYGMGGLGGLFGTSAWKQWHLQMIMSPSCTSLVFK